MARASTELNLKLGADYFMTKGGCANFMIEQLAKNGSAVEAEHHLFRAMFENATVGMALLDIQGRVIKSNRALQEMLGYASEELHQVIPGVLNLDKIDVESALFEQLMAGKRHSYQLEKHFLGQGKSMQWGRLTFSLVQSAGEEPSFALCLLEDITEQKQVKAAQQHVLKQQQAIRQKQVLKQFEVSRQEQTPTSNQDTETQTQQVASSVEQLGEMLNDILSSSSELFFVYDQTGKYIYVNRAAAQTFGLTQSDFINKSWQQLNLPAEIMERLDAQREGVLATGQPLTDEASFSTVDDVRDYEYTISPISDINNSPKAIVITIRDITEHKRAAAAASIALAKEEEFSTLKSHVSYFTSTVAQELRNPLHTIFSCAKLLERNEQQGTDEKKVNYLQLIQANVRRLNQLLNDLLLIKKVEAKELQLKPDLLDLTEFCGTLTQELQQGAGRDHKITFISQGECGGVYMDKKLLRHILTNLLLNAIKYSLKGSEVLLNLVCQGEQVSFRIQDSGIGIPEKDQELLFKAFHRGSNVGAVLGSGLGLLMVKQCVDLQKGEILVESEVNVGTTFTVTLPLNRS